MATDTGSQHPFLAYLVSLLSIYEHGPSSAPIPEYDGPSDGQTDTILHSLGSMAKRMYAIEEAYNAIKASDSDDKTQRSVNVASTTEESRTTPPASESINPLLSIPPASHATAVPESESDINVVEELRLLKAQVQDVTRVCSAVARGDLSQKVTIPVHDADMAQLKEVTNSMVDCLGRFVTEVTRASLEIGAEGILGVQTNVHDVQGAWKVSLDNINLMATNLTDQVRSIAEVAKAIALGDLNKRVTVEARGELLGLKATVNTMAEFLTTFVDEVMRLVKEVGNDGKLGDRVRSTNASGTWKDLEDNVNVLVANLTVQVRTIALAISAAAQGNFTQVIVGLDASGEMLDLVNSVNRLIEQMAMSAAQ